jgi:hypothetical protein
MKTGRIPATRRHKQINLSFNLKPYSCRASRRSCQPMKKDSCSSINSDQPEIVKPADPDPAWIIALVDLIFLAQDEGRVVPS